MVGFVDIHSHFLYDIDDGPKDIEGSISMLKEMKSEGISAVFSTSHFNIGEIKIEEFIKKRDERIASLKDVSKEIGIEIKKGAEVFISSLLPNLELLPSLALEGTNYILIELPYIQNYPNEYNNVISKIMRNFNLIPIIVHAERYNFFAKKPAILENLINMGCLVQITANTLSEKNFMFVDHLIKNNYTHFIATDSHNLQKRPPKIKEAISFSTLKHGEKKIKEMLKNQQDLLVGKQIPYSEPGKLTHLFGKYYI